jgi:hypothetical protein
MYRSYAVREGAASMLPMMPLLHRESWLEFAHVSSQDSAIVPMPLPPRHEKTMPPISASQDVLMRL